MILRFEHYHSSVFVMSKSVDIKPLNVTIKLFLQDCVVTPKI